MYIIYIHVYCSDGVAHLICNEDKLKFYPFNIVRRGGRISRGFDPLGPEFVVVEQRTL